MLKTVLNKVTRWLGMGRYDAYVRNHLELANMRSSIYMSVFMIFVEVWMILRIVREVLFGTENRSAEWIIVHLRLYVILLAASIVMLCIAAAYVRGKKRAGPAVSISIRIIYSLICLAFGFYVSYLDYVKGEQILSFITMLLFVICLLTWRPIFSITLLSAAILAFYHYCDLARPATVATDINLFTTWIAFMMISISSYNQRLSEAEKDRGLEYVSTHDDLTGIGNMHIFRRKARDLFENARAAGKQLTLLYFDIVGFKTFNESRGFTDGSKLLTRVADELTGAFPDGVTARLSDDHFVVLTEEPEPEGIVESLNRNLASGGNELFLELKAGIYRTDGSAKNSGQTEDINLLCDRARFACDSVKHKNGVLCCRFDEQLHEQQRRKRYIISHIDAALENGLIEVYYQPIVMTSSGAVCGLECLARWNDPVYGSIPPSEFIEFIEESRAVHKLDMYIIEHACADFKEAGELGYFQIPISVNLSRLDFELYDIATFITQTAEKYAVPKESLDIEITESALTKSSDALSEAIERLRGEGYRIWLDDFGSGYSSFNVLKDYIFDVLKIDMRFLESFGENDKTAPIFNSILACCNQLEMVSLTEGVETMEEFEFLKSIGCDRVQGYLFSRPITKHELRRMLDAGTLVPYRDNPSDGAEVPEDK